MRIGSAPVRAHRQRERYDVHRRLSFDPPLGVATLRLNAWPDPSHRRLFTVLRCRGAAAVTVVCGEKNELRTCSRSLRTRLLHRPKRLRMPVAERAIGSERVDLLTK